MMLLLLLLMAVYGAANRFSSALLAGPYCCSVQPKAYYERLRTYSNAGYYVADRGHTLTANDGVELVHAHTHTHADSHPHVNTHKQSLQLSAEHPRRLAHRHYWVDTNTYTHKRAHTHTRPSGGACCCCCCCCC
uniref:Putative secreted protein n=1 Tax=Anopheles triannulatus TaxID=58253 RepID=A0A2M4B172_9DIPT